MFMLKWFSTAKDVLEFISQFYPKGEGEKTNTTLIPAFKSLKVIRQTVKLEFCDANLSSININRCQFLCIFVYSSFFKFKINNKYL